MKFGALARDHFQIPSEDAPDERVVDTHAQFLLKEHQSMRWLHFVLIVVIAALSTALDAQAQTYGKPKSDGLGRLALDHALLVSVDPSRGDEARVESSLPLRELVVQPGENVSRLLERAHVLPNATALHLTQQANPSIADISRLRPGERLKLPSIEDYQMPASSGGGLVRFIDPAREKVSADLGRRIQVLASEADRQDLEGLARDLELNAYRLSLDELDGLSSRSWLAIREVRARGSVSQINPLKTAMSASLRSPSARWEVRVRTTVQGQPRCHVRVWYALSRQGSPAEQFRELSKPIAKASLPPGNYKLADSAESLARPDPFTLSVRSTDDPSGIDVDLEVNPAARECSP